MGSLTADFGCGSKSHLDSWALLLLSSSSKSSLKLNAMALKIEVCWGEDSGGGCIWKTERRLVASNGRQRRFSLTRRMWRKWMPVGRWEFFDEFVLSEVCFGYRRTKVLLRLAEWMRLRRVPWFTISRAKNHEASTEGADGDNSLRCSREKDAGFDLEQCW